MYQHPAALDLNASYYQDEALRSAENRRLARLVNDGDQHTSAQHRLVAAAVTVLLLLAVVVLI